MSVDFAGLCDQASELVRQANWAEAAELLQAALTVEPCNTDVMDHLAECLLNLEQMDRAVELLQHSIRVAPDSSHSKYMYMAQIMGHGMALQYYAKGLDVLQQHYLACQDPATADELRNEFCAGCCAVAELYLTDLCDEDNAPEECEKWLERGRQCKADYPELYQFLGSLRISQNREADAKKALAQALSLLQQMDEDNRPPYNSQVELAKLLLQVHEGQSARDVLLHLLEQDDERPIVWLLLGTCYRMLCRPRNALRCLSRAEQLAIKQPDVDVLDEEEDDEDGSGGLLPRVQADLAQVRGELGAAADSFDPAGELSDSDGEAGGEEDEEEDGDAEGAGEGMHD